MPVPLVIVGGGRWGRTWLSVVIAARGSTEGVVLAARSRPEEVRAWASGRADLAKLNVVSGLDEALSVNPRLHAAIISSRPRDHVRDGIEAVRRGLHVLVEKPISVDCESGWLLVGVAERARRVLGVGTEFAYLPAFHQLAEELAGAGKVDASLIWDDIANEERHGAIKVRHEEIGLLHDLLPHAFSILRILVPNGELRVGAAELSADGRRGHLEFTDARGGCHQCRFDAAAPARRRILEVRADSARALVDFDVHSLITINDQPRTVDPQLSQMTSTLRLELGAFLSQTTGAISVPFTNWDASGLLSVQADMERMLAPAD